MNIGKIQFNYLVLGIIVFAIGAMLIFSGIHIVYGSYVSLELTVLAYLGILTALAGIALVILALVPRKKGL